MKDISALKANAEINIKSFMYAYIVCIPFINYAIGKILGSGSFMIHLCVICLFVLFNLPAMKKIRTTPAFIIYIFIVYIFYYATEYSTMEPKQFYFNFVIPMLVGLFEKDDEKFLRYMTYSSLLILAVCAPILVDLKRESVADEAASVMGLSYSMVPIIVAGFFHFSYYRDKSNWLLSLCYLIDVVFAVILVLYSNRGAVFNLLLAVLCLYIVKFRKNKKSKGMTIKIVLIAILVYIVYIYFFDILNAINEFVNSFDIKIDFIDKMIRLNKNSDVTNGRKDIQEYVVENILKSPIWGHGLSSIYFNSHGRVIYPHNLVLQLLYDGGLILAVPTLICIIKSVNYIFIGRNKESVVTFMYFILICIPKMFFSSDIWSNPAFWLFVGYYLNYFGSIKKKERILYDK